MTKRETFKRAGVNMEAGISTGMRHDVKQE